VYIDSQLERHGEFNIMTIVLSSLVLAYITEVIRRLHQNKEHYLTVETEVPRTFHQVQVQVSRTFNKVQVQILSSDLWMEPVYFFEHRCRYRLHL
jgi:hypothetical protein